MRRGALQVATKLAPTYGALLEAVKSSPIVSPDESGWRVGGLFEDFRVTSITRDLVAVEKNGQSLVLSRHTKGE